MAVKKKAPVKKTKKKVTKLKFKKKPTTKVVSAKSVKAEEYLPVDKNNKKVNQLITMTGLDIDRIGGLGRFIKMDDNQLSVQVPRGGKGNGNNLTPDEIDARLVYVHRLSLRGYTLEQIAVELGVSTVMVTKIKNQIKDVHRRSFTNIDINEWLGTTMAFFEEVRDVAMLISSTPTNGTKERITALNCAVTAEMSKSKFLDYCGVFSHIQQNQQLISKVIQQAEETDVDEVAEVMDTLALSLFNV